MSHTIKYSGTRAEMRDAALRDCQFWLGDKYSHIESVICDELRKCRGYTARAVRTIIFQLAFAGIQGYPARAFTLHCLRLNKE